jgi:hypothetical protein
LVGLVTSTHGAGRHNAGVSTPFKQVLFPWLVGARPVWQTTAFDSPDGNVSFQPAPFEPFAGASTLEHEAGALVGESSHIGAPMPSGLLVFGPELGSPFLHETPNVADIF